MSVGQELLDTIAAFIEGRIALSDLQLWLAGHVQIVADAGDPDATELSDRAWIVVAEWLDGFRDEPNARAELAAFLRQRASEPTQPVVTASQ
jgi:hypothetical protein